MRIIKKILSFLFPKDTSRRYPEDIKPGEYIIVEWYKIIGRIGRVKCINNDPVTRKVFIEATWNNKPGKDYAIFSYDSEELKNFHLLNAKQKPLPPAGPPPEPGPR